MASDARQIAKDLRRASELLLQMFPLLTPEDAHPNHRVVAGIIADAIDSLEASRPDARASADLLLCDSRLDLQCELRFGHAGDHAACRAHPEPIHWASSSPSATCEPKGTE